MDTLVSTVVIAGGGTAGWLSAAWLAAWARQSGNPPLAITLVESPDIPTVGVGEGTWPTFRETLAAIGIAEDEFLRCCEASFKQGSRFDGWLTGEPADSYFHPFSPPPQFDARQLVAAWATKPRCPFAATMTNQVSLCANDLAPRQPAMPQYSGATNYAYHLDAGALVALLRYHAVDRLGVKHIAGEINRVERDEMGGIDAVCTVGGDRFAGDLFIDCTGHKALLIEGALETAWTDCSTVLFNDRALAAQVPVTAGSPIASQTIGTAHEAGWLWDIGLARRRGIGCVYSSKFTSDERAAAILEEYVSLRLPGARDYAVRRLAFPTGYREQFWSRNCVAVGLSAGFIEPLEASAIVLIELSLRALTEAFPLSRERMPFLAERFNELFTSRWERIVEFLKLHYVLSERTEPYWRAHRERHSVPERLAELLKLWRDQPPSVADFPLADEIFPAASYQYVYFGMGGPGPERLPAPSAELRRQIEGVAQRGRSLAAVLPTNRDYLDRLAECLAVFGRESAA